MFQKKFIVSVTLFAIFLAACAPAAPSPTPSVTPPPIMTEEPTAPATGVAVVESVDVQILESMPIQVNVVIRGTLPDAGCTTIAEVNQVREGNTIKITMTTTTDPLALCAQALTPFERVVPLEISDLPAGQYTVDVGGVLATFELPNQSTSSFDESLVAAMNARDFEALKAMMGESFMIGYWQSEGVSYTPDEAVEQLQLNLLNGDSPITADSTKDLTALLGVDPVTIVGPEVTEVSPVLVGGLGAEGKDEAILFIARRADGSPYWYGMLFAKDGFASSGPLAIEPIDENTFATSVQYVMAQKDLKIYDGPGTSYKSIGDLFGGQVAQVTGTDVNGSWWRITCPDASLTSCWVSGDPADTQPTEAP